TAGTAAGTGRAAGRGGIAHGVAVLANKAAAAVVLQACSSTIATSEAAAGADAGADAVTGKAAGAGGIAQGVAPMAAIPAAAVATTVGEPAEMSPLQCDKPALTVGVSAGPAIGIMASVSPAAGAGCCVNVGAANASNANATSFSSEDAFLAR
ncbi:unnamed protein product, partial [Ectocarpus sp. 12 AP-2014]